MENQNSHRSKASNSDAPGVESSPPQEKRKISILALAGQLAQGGFDALVPEKMEKIIQSEHRTDNEASILFETVKRFEFFENFNERYNNSFFDKNGFIQMCKRLKYRKFPAREVIFHQGEPSNGELYIVYSGEVSITQSDHPLYVSSPERAKELERKHRFDGALKRSTLESQTNLSDIEEQSPGLKEKKESKDSKILSANSSQKNKLGILSPLKLLDKRMGTPKITPGETPKVSSRADEGTFLTAQNESVKKSKWAKVSQMSREESEAKLHEGRKRRESIRVGLNTLMKNLNKSSPPKMNQENLESKDQLKSKGETLKAKFRHVTNLTLSAIRFGKMFGGWGKNIGKKKQNESIEPVISLDEFTKNYGVLQQKVEIGGFFGEKAIFVNQTRPVTALTNTECEFLVLNKRDFQIICKNFDCKRKDRINFMMKYIPEAENITVHESFEKLLSLLQEQTFERGHYIAREGARGDSIFILFEGSCEIYKTVKFEEPCPLGDHFTDLEKLLRTRKEHSQQIPIYNLQKGVFLCEEVLYDGRTKYNFSIRVTSASAKVFVIKNTDFFKDVPKQIQTEVQKGYSMKVRRYASLIKDMITIKYPDTMLVSNFKTQKELDLYLVYGKVRLIPKSANDLSSFHRVLHTPTKQDNRFSGDQDNLNQSAEQRSNKVNEVYQMKQTIYPFLRSIISPTQTFQRGKHVRTQSAVRATRQEARSREDQPDSLEPLRNSHMINSETKYRNRDTMCQTSYISSMMQTERPTEPSAEQVKALGMRIDIKREIDEVPQEEEAAQASPKSKRKSIEDPIKMMALDLSIDELFNGDKKAQKFHEIKKQMLMTVKQPQPVASPIGGDRVKNLFKHNHRKKKGTCFLQQFLVNNAGLNKMTEMVDNYQMSNETLDMTLNSPPKQENKKMEDINKLIMTQINPENSFAPVDLSNIIKKSRKTYSIFIQENKGFSIAPTHPTDYIREGTLPTNNTCETRSNQCTSRSDKKQKTHSERLKEKHKMLLQLRRRPKRHELGLQSNSVSMPPVHNSNSAKNSHNEH